ncbi:hypothetical protein TREES_T100021722 [Tupaia chinensis]|uniref:Uncharacterized protein n=1 Tax=Tupaia chinensis TaxID=246437 RepID=L9JKE8_TUPCH|nr:hypothetical protein TREES_T100021722 [Tupaia chinensis]
MAKSSGLCLHWSPAHSRWAFEEGGWAPGTAHCRWGGPSPSPSSGRKAAASKAGEVAGCEIDCCSGCLEAPAADKLKGAGHHSGARGDDYLRLSLKGDTEDWAPSEPPRRAGAGTALGKKQGVQRGHQGRPAVQ